MRGMGAVIRERRGGGSRDRIYDVSWDLFGIRKSRCSNYK